MPIQKTHVTSKKGKKWFGKPFTRTPTIVKDPYGKLFTHSVMLIADPLGNQSRIFKAVKTSLNLQNGNRAKQVKNNETR